MAPSDRTYVNGHILKYRKFYLNERKKKNNIAFMEHFGTFVVLELWNRLLRETVESPSLEISKTQMDTALRNQHWETLL